MGVEQAHVAIEFVDAARIAQLNGEHRGKPAPDRRALVPDRRRRRRSPAAVPIELGRRGDLPRAHADVREAVVHGMLHLLGMDHETDDGEMLALQRELLAGADG